MSNNEIIQQQNNPHYSLRSADPLYACAWSFRTDKPMRNIVSTVFPRLPNQIYINEFNPVTNAFDTLVRADVPYPISRIVYCPDPQIQRHEYFATASDCIRLYAFETNEMKSTLDHKVTLTHSTDQHFTIPSTSLVWSARNYSTLVSAAVDGTLNLWNVATNQLNWTLICHDGPIYDIQCSPHLDSILSVGEDGMVKMTDLRFTDKIMILHDTSSSSLASSSVVPDRRPMSRVAWNSLDSNYIACVALHENRIMVFDIRASNKPLVELQGHVDGITHIQWSPFSSTHLMSSGEDGRLNLWDLQHCDSLHPNDAELTYSHIDVDDTPRLYMQRHNLSRYHRRMKLFMKHFNSQAPRYKLRYALQLPTRVYSIVMPAAPRSQRKKQILGELMERYNQTIPSHDHLSSTTQENIPNPMELNNANVPIESSITDPRQQQQSQQQPQQPQLPQQQEETHITSASTRDNFGEDLPDDAELLGNLADPNHALEVRQSGIPTIEVIPDQSFLSYDWQPNAIDFNRPYFDVGTVESTWGANPEKDWYTSGINYFQWHPSQKHREMIAYTTDRSFEIIRL